jgi:hypothetical protein
MDMRAGRIAAILLASGLAVAGAQRAAAHHSGAMYDAAKTVAVEGVVKEWLYQNPHSLLSMTVVEPGGLEKQWDIEGSGSSVLIRWGIKRSSFLPGEKITVRVHPLKDGRRGALFIDATKADGTVLARPG